MTATSGKIPNQNWLSICCTPRRSALGNESRCSWTAPGGTAVHSTIPASNTAYFTKEVHTTGHVTPTRTDVCTRPNSLSSGTESTRAPKQSQTKAAVGTFDRIAFDPL